MHDTLGAIIKSLKVLQEQSADADTLKLYDLKLQLCDDERPSGTRQQLTVADGGNVQDVVGAVNATVYEGRFGRLLFDDEVASIQPDVSVERVMVNGGDVVNRTEARHCRSRCSFQKSFVITALVLCFIRAYTVILNFMKFMQGRRFIFICPCRRGGGQK